MMALSNRGVYLANVDAGRFESASVFIPQICYGSNGVQSGVFGQCGWDHFQSFSIGTAESELN